MKLVSFTSELPQNDPNNAKSEHFQVFLHFRQLLYIFCEQLPGFKWFSKPNIDYFWYPVGAFEFLTEIFC